MPPGRAPAAYNPSRDSVSCPDLACCARRGGVGSARPAIVIYTIQNLWAPASVEGGSVVAASEARATPMQYIQSRTSGCPARRGRRVPLTCRVLRYLQFPFRALTIQKACSQICFGSRAIDLGRTKKILTLPTSHCHGIPVPCWQFGITSTQYSSEK